MASARQGMSPRRYRRQQGERSTLVGSAIGGHFPALLGRFGGAPYRELQRNLADADLTRLRDAKIMIVEENESFVARTATSMSCARW